MKHPGNSLQTIQSKTKSKNKRVFCFAYQNDLDEAYAFYCARYENISWKEFLHLGFTEFKKKLSSIPKDEPLYDIIKSRVIDVSSIKDKEERKYWRKLKRQYAIPQFYLSTEEIYRNLKEEVKQNRVKL